MYDMFIGLMLSSGNDASILLAENFGRFLIIESLRNSKQSLKKAIEKDPFNVESTKVYVSVFVSRMNSEAKKLKLQDSCFSNPHGLSDKANKSSAQDVNRLTKKAMEYSLFKEIISKQVYISKTVFDYDYLNEDGEQGALI